jgi:hypothetical protein
VTNGLFKRKLQHRCKVWRMTATTVDGVPAFVWSTVAENQKCRLDLSYMRRGKDEAWVQEAGRAQDRNGVLFALPDFVARSGDRIEITSPPSLLGTYLLDGAVDLAIGRVDVEHFEMGVTEVPANATAEGK